MRIKFLVFGLLFSLSVAAKQPSIDKGSVIFNDGSFLKYSKYKEYFDNPKEAYDKGLPFSVETEVRLLKRWEIVFLQKKYSFFEGGYNELSFFDFNGNLIFPSINYSGLVRVLEDSERIFLIGQKSYLYNKKGVLINSLELPESIEKVDVSENECFIFIQNYGYKNNYPVTQLSIYNNNGELVNTRYFTQGGKEKITVGKVDYEIDILEPTIPG